MTTDDAHDLCGLGLGQQRAQKCLPWDFPDDPVVKNSPAKAGDSGSIPGSEIKIPHASGQLSPCTATNELTL